MESTSSLNDRNKDDIVSVVPPLHISHSPFFSLDPKIFSLDGGDFPTLLHSPAPEIPAQHANQIGQPKPNPYVSISPDVKGCLSLKGNPGPWIVNNPTDSHLLVKHLVIDFSAINDEDHEIEESIDQLTCLSNYWEISMKALPISMSNLHNLQHLTFQHCQELPANLGVLKMLSSLTHLTLERCNIKSAHLAELSAKLGELQSLKRFSLKYCNRLKSLPNSMSNLLNLESLSIQGCDFFIELPVNLWELGSLKHLSLKYCNRLKSLPNSMSKLLSLQSLSIQGCDFFIELPASLGQLWNLKYISLDNCNRLQYLPNSMSNLLNLESLFIQRCDFLTELPANLNVTYLQLISSSIKFIPSGLMNLCRLHVTPHNSSQGWFANLKDSPNLHILSFPKMYTQGFVKFPDNLKGLNELILLDIKDTTINYLPWSITELTKLRLLLLPSEFRLETLPSHLNDSVLISVKGKHARKTWKEIGVPEFPIVQAEYPSNVSPPGYLQLEQDVSQWICDDYNSLMLVKILDFALPFGVDFERTQNAIGEFSNLTHLYLSGSELYQDYWLPNTITGLAHLSLESYVLKFQSGNLNKLSNLVSLGFIRTAYRLARIYGFPYESKTPLYTLWLYEVTSSWPGKAIQLDHFGTLWM